MLRQLKEVEAKEENNCVIERFIIAKESHKDGGRHFHVYLKMEEKLKTRNPHLFDLLFE